MEHWANRVQILYSTSCMEHRRHDGGDPRGLTVGGMEIVLQVSVEDPYTGGECQGQCQDHDGGNQDYPAPTTIRGIANRSRWRRPPSMEALLTFSVVGHWNFLLLHTIGLLVAHGGLRATPRHSSSISLSHFFLCSCSARCAVTSEAHVTVTTTALEDSWDKINNTKSMLALSFWGRLVYLYTGEEASRHIPLWCYICQACTIVLYQS